MTNKNIAIDYDDTISLNIEAWQLIINLFTSLGANVYIVTYRASTQFDDMNMSLKNVRDYIFTNAMAKRNYCEEVAGLKIDIWIDDFPESVVYDYGELLKI